MEWALVEPTPEGRITELQLRLKQEQDFARNAWTEAASYRNLLRQCCEAADNADCQLVLNIAGPVINSAYDEVGITKLGATFLEDCDRTRIERDDARKSLEKIRVAVEELGDDPREQEIKTQILELIQMGMKNCL